MLLAFWMVQRLTRERNDLEREIMDMHTQLTHYQKYASRLGGSSIMNLNNIAGLSAELLPRASLFAQYSDQASSMSAMQNLQAMKAMGRVPMTGDPNTQMQIEMSAFAQFKEQALKDLKQQETAILNEKEKEMELALNEKETELKTVERKLDSYQKLLDQGVERLTPKFS